MLALLLDLPSCSRLIGQAAAAVAWALFGLHEAPLRIALALSIAGVPLASDRIVALSKPKEVRAGWGRHVMHSLRPFTCTHAERTSIACAHKQAATPRRRAALQALLHRLAPLFLPSTGVVL